MKPAPAIDTTGGQVKESAPAKKKKDLSVESLRGLAILLVIAFHSISENAGEAYLHHKYSLVYIRMPLFTVISGFVYAIRPVGRGYQFPYLKGKARRVLLPFISVATLQYMMKALMPGVNSSEKASEVWKIFIYSYEHLWYLQSLMLVFVVVTILETYNILSTLRGVVMVVLSTALLTLVSPSMNLVEPLDGFIYLLPYFIFGAGLKRFNDRFRETPWVVGASIIAVAGLALQQIGLAGIVDIPLDTRGPLALVVGLTSTLLLFHWRRNIPGLRTLGQHAYPIYLFQGFGIAVGERLARLVPGHSEFYIIPFLSKLITGIIVSLIIEAIMMRQKWLRRIFLGLR